MPDFLFSFYSQLSAKRGRQSASSDVSNNCNMVAFLFGCDKPAAAGESSQNIYIQAQNLHFSVMVHLSTHKQHRRSFYLPTLSS